MIDKCNLFSIILIDSLANISLYIFLLFEFISFRKYTAIESWKAILFPMSTPRGGGKKYRKIAVYSITLFLFSVVLSMFLCNRLPNLLILDVLRWIWGHLD